MEDTYPQPPIGYSCTSCGGIADVEMDGIYLCARDALRTMGANPQAEWDGPTPAGRESVVLVDLTDVGEIRLEAVEAIPFDPPGTGPTMRGIPSSWQASASTHTTRTD